MTKLLLTTILAATLALVGTASADELPDPGCFKLTGVIVGMDEIGMVNEGLRIDVDMEGDVAEGLLAGSTGTASSRNLIRHDGVSEFDIRMFIIDPDGAAIAATVMGYQPPLMPMTLAEMLDAMLDPEYAPPDVYGPLHGAAWFQTMAPQYAFLNHSVYWLTGEANMATGHMWVIYCPIAP